MKNIIKFLIACTLFLTLPHFSAHAATEDTNLKVTTHNVYFLPQALYPNWGQMQRADLISKAPFIENNDVMIFNELFDAKSTAQLKSNLKSSYPHQTPVLGEEKDKWDATHGRTSGAKFTNGGVSILSRYPIMRQEQHFYTQGRGADGMAKKGFVYVKINKNGHPFHIIGTHLQSEIGKRPEGKDAEIRSTQMAEIRQFIKEKNIPKNEMVVIGGDLNVIKGSSEYHAMLSQLNVNEPSYIGHNQTWDTTTNSIAKYNYPDLKPQYLDYILVDKAHAQPSQWYNNAHRVSSPEWTVSSWGKTYTYQDYSDHYPVSASNAE